MEPGGFRDELDPDVSEEEMARDRRRNTTFGLIGIALCLGYFLVIAIIGHIQQPTDCHPERTQISRDCP